MCLQQDKLSSNEKSFQDITFNDISDTGIPDILMNIISCHGLSIEDKAIVILTFHIKLVSYYLSKGFVIIDHELYALKNAL